MDPYQLRLPPVLSTFSTKINLCKIHLRTVIVAVVPINVSTKEAGAVRKAVEIKLLITLT